MTLRFLPDVFIGAGLGLPKVIMTTVTFMVKGGSGFDSVSMRRVTFLPSITTFSQHTPGAACSSIPRGGRGAKFCTPLPRHRSQSLRQLRRLATMAGFTRQGKAVCKT